MTTTVFLPGAGGRRSFWEPVAGRLALGRDALLVGWPGFGDEPPQPSVRSLSDLTTFVLDRSPSKGDFNLVAQSMGGVVALQIALAAPDRLSKLVLCGTSGGIDFAGIEREDWRPAYRSEMSEQTPRWFLDDRTDLTHRLGEITAPALLLWAAEDRIVPPAAGELLARRLPNASLIVIPGAAHDAPVTHAADVARHIRQFLALETHKPRPFTRTAAERAPLPPASDSIPAVRAPSSRNSPAPSPSRERDGVTVTSANLPPARTPDSRSRDRKRLP